MKRSEGCTLPYCCVLFLILAFLSLGPASAVAQDWVRTGTNLGAQRIRLAAANFNPASSDPGTASLKTTFDTTFFNDLSNSGIFDMVSKSIAPPGMPANPQQMNLAQWSAPPASAAMVAFGSLAVNNGQVVVYGWLFDAKNQTSPQILGKQYTEAASQDNARLIAHRFADEIITLLGGGIPGIAETHIFYVSSRGEDKEIWQMDYDGQGSKPITHLGTISLSPRPSPDNSRVAFASLGRQGWSIRMYSLVLGRMVSFPGSSGNNFSPAWSSDGTKLAFSSSRTGDPGDLYVRREWGQSEARDLIPRAGCLAHVESEDEFADSVVQRPHRLASDLHHGCRWNKRAAADRWRIRYIALMVSQRAVSGFRLGPKIRSGRARRPGHLHHGHRQQALDPTHAQPGTQRFAFLVSRWTAYRLSAAAGRRGSDLDHARRRNRTARAHPERRKYDAELELEIRRL